MTDLHTSPKKDHGSTGSNNKCDTCGEAITAIVTRAPGVHRAAPCGHRVSQQYIGKRRVVTDGGSDTCTSGVNRTLHDQYEPDAPIHRAVNITSRALKDRCEVIEHDEYDLYVGKDPVTGVKTDFWREERQEAIGDVAHAVEMDTCYLNECLTYLGEDSDRLYCDEHDPDEYIECAEEDCEFPTNHTETDYCSTHTWRNGRSAEPETNDQEGDR